MSSSQTSPQKLTPPPVYDRRSKGRVIHKDASKHRILPEDHKREFLHNQSVVLQPLQDRRNMPRTSPVNHWRNLLIWVGLILAAMGVSQAFHFFFNHVSPPLSVMPALNSVENEAFMALNVRVVDAGTAHSVVLDSALKKQLVALKKAHYTSVKLEQINRWQHSASAELPAKPVLITFDEARRDTMEITDAILASLGMSALVFVDVDKLDKGNLQLVSWHQLEKLVRSGRWDVGISGCVGGDESAFTSDTLLAQKFVRQREQLERQLQIPITTVNCTRRASINTANGVARWNKALQVASLQTGFVAASFGANYRQDTKTHFKRIDVTVPNSAAQLLAALNRYAPRRTAFVDSFYSKDLDSNWVVGNGSIVPDNGLLTLQSKDGEQGALMTLGGTEKWQDAEVEVSLKNKPNGQFWIALRQGIGQSFLRLGLANDKVMLQETNGSGLTKVLAEYSLPIDTLTLKLRVVGSRVMAYLNGVPLLARPVKTTHTADHGAFSLAVWPDSFGVKAGAASAFAQVMKISATPLAQKSAIVAPVLGAVAWAKLRQQADTLSIVSPNYFTWSGGVAKSLARHNISLEIFAWHHHLKILPAVLINEATPLSEIKALTEQALIWVADPSYQGLNIILKNSVVDDKWQAFLNTVKQRLSQLDKTLVVTLLNDNSTLPITQQDGLLLVTDQMRFISTAPVVLYPHSAKP